jgi:hypothetical protein
MSVAPPPLEMCVRSVRDCAMHQDSRLNCCSERTHDGLIKKLCYIEIPVSERGNKWGPVRDLNR